MARPKADTFKKYDCLVRLGGSRNNEVTKRGVTAPEILVLATLHGGDAIANVKPSGEKPFNHSDAVERSRLAQLYEGNKPAKRGFIQRVFGPATIPLPREHAAETTAAVEKQPSQMIPRDLEDAIDPAAAVMS